MSLFSDRQCTDCAAKNKEIADLKKSNKELVETIEQIKLGTVGDKNFSWTLVVDMFQLYKKYCEEFKTELEKLQAEVVELRKKKKYVYPLFGQKQFADMREEIDMLQSKVDKLGGELLDAKEARSIEAEHRILMQTWIAEIKKQLDAEKLNDLLRVIAPSLNSFERNFCAHKLSAYYIGDWFCDGKIKL